MLIEVRTLAARSWRPARARRRERGLEAAAVEAAAVEAAARTGQPAVGRSLRVWGMVRYPCPLGRVDLAQRYMVTLFEFLNGVGTELIGGAILYALVRTERSDSDD